MHIDDRSDEIEICAYCPLMCKNVDAFHRHDGTEASAPHIRNLMLQKVLQRHNKDSEEEIKEHLKSASDILYKTTLGGENTAWCGNSMDIRANMLAGRADLVEHGFEPDGVKRIEKRTREEHNPYGEDHVDRFAKIDDDIIADVTNRPEATVGTWVGCTTAYYQPEIFENLISVLNTAGITPKAMTEERCSGLPQYKLGLRETAFDLMEYNANIINDSNVDQLIVDSPECYRAFNEFYPHFGYELETKVIHSSHFLQELASSGSIGFDTELNQKIAYHDSYELSRHTTPTSRKDHETSDIHSAPRELIDNISGVERVELRHNREKAFSCGADLGVQEMYSDIGRDVARTVLNEIERAGAKKVVVGSPACKQHLSDVIRKDNLNFTVVSLPEIVAQANSALHQRSNRPS